MNSPPHDLPANLRKLEAELDAMEGRLLAYTPRPPWQAPGPDDAERLVAAGPRQIENAAFQLSEILEGPLTVVATNPDAQKKHMHAAVTRLEACVRTIKDEHAKVKTLSDTLPLNYGLTLLTHSWKELDEHIQEWLMNRLDPSAPFEWQALRLTQNDLPSLVSLVAHLQSPAP